MIDTFARVDVLVGSLLFYLLVSKPLFASFRDVVGLTPESPSLKLFVFLHNCGLCLFSFVVVVKSWPIVFTGFSTYGWVGVHCEPTFWVDSGFGFWADVFYVSKYYEFVDSWILVLKGKNPSFLQVYHHTGIALAMYFATQSHCNWLLWVVCLNSFIHTLMYAYFAAATLGYKSPLAQTLTTMQLLQFVTGIVFSSTTYFSSSGICGRAETRGPLIFTQLYAGGLIYLFKQMYDEKYKAAKAAKAAKESKSS